MSVVEATLIVVRGIHFASTATLSGILMFLPLVARPAFGVGASAEKGLDLILRIRRMAYFGVAITIVSGAIWVLVETISMSGFPLATVMREGLVWTVLTRTTFGITSDIRLFFAILLSLILMTTAAGRRADLFAAVVAVPVIGGIAWTGHAAASSGYLHLTADVLHLIAAGAWIGSLVPLAMLLAMARREKGPEWARIARTATLRFSNIGVVSVATLLTTGIVNAFLLTGSLPALLGTDYGHVLLLKIGLFAIMVALATTNRLRWTPRLSELPDTSLQLNGLHRITRNAQVEIALGLIIFAIVGALGNFVPGLHAQSVWPLPFRLHGDFLGDLEAITAFGTILVGIGLMLGGIIRRHMRWPLIIGGITMAVFSGRALDDLIIPAYPTTFYVSPTGYSAASVVRGREAFADHCAMCHGPEGRGDGSAAASLGVKPADLTSDHIYAHTDGDLLWWINHGIADVMPGFESVLDENSRWDLIDFIHANADAIRLSAAAGKTSPTGYPVPNFEADCESGPTISIGELKGRVVDIVLAASASTEQLASLSARGRAAGVTTLLITAGASIAPAVGICVANSKNTFEALSLYRRTPRKSDEAELLVDSAGSLRAVWYPGLEPDWTDPVEFRKLGETVRNAPAVARTIWASHAHH
jgi:putative copper export protein/mono/diheme cytochrome c family protein